MTKQAAIRAINEAKTVDELRAVLLAMVEKQAWPVEVDAGGYRFAERAGHRAK